jgi:hypothetical protein
MTTGWAGWKWLLPVLVSGWKRFVALLDTIESIPVALADVGAMKEQIGVITAVTTRIQQMVLPNGGSSLPDKMDAMKKSFDSRSELLASMQKDITGISQMQKARLNVDSNTACFETDPYGKVIEATITRTFTRWAGLQVTELSGWGWINIIHPEDMSRVRSAYLSAVQDCRTLIVRFAMIMHDGIAHEVELQLTPVPDGANPCEKFFGALTKVEENEK